MKHYKIMEIVETHNTTTKTFVSQTFMSKSIADEKVERLNRIATKSYVSRKCVSGTVPGVANNCAHCNRRDFFSSTALDPYNIFDEDMPCYSPYVLPGTFICEDDECYRVVCERAWWDFDRHDVVKVHYETVEVDE